MAKQQMIPIDTSDEQTNQKQEPDSASTSMATETIEATEVLTFVEQAQRALDSVRQILSGPGIAISPWLNKSRTGSTVSTADQEGARIIEGAFDGQNMLGPDGKQYSVPANYASKSKLVEGDVLKLTITKDGSFIYKQIGPVERQRLIGKLSRDEVTSEYRVVVDEHSYKVLLASITYFKGEPGDDVVILIPTAGEARWAAVENIIKQGLPTTSATG